MKNINIEKDTAREIHCTISFLDFKNIFSELVKFNNERPELSFKCFELRSMTLIWLLQRASICVPIAFIEDYLKIFTKLTNQLTCMMNKLFFKHYGEVQRFDYPENMDFLGTKLCQLSVTHCISNDYMEHCRGQLESFFWEIFGEDCDINFHICLCKMQWALIQSYLNYLMQPHDDIEDYFIDASKSYLHPSEIELVWTYEKPERTDENESN